MKEFYVIVGKCVNYTEHIGQYEEYPSKEELEKCLMRSNVIWVSVEKRYTNRPITYQGIGDYYNRGNVE